MKRLLLVEDDTNLTGSLSDYLRPEGFEILHAATAAEARRIAPADVDVVILDWMLPDGAGIDLLREWRQRGIRTPVVLLTARSELVDRVLGLELGANDYVMKPFEPRELLARLRVQLRQQEATPATRLSYAGLELDLVTRELRYQGREVPLVRQEYELLKLFLQNPERVFSREEILNQAWGYEYYPTTRTVDTHVLQLRQKIDASLIETVRGIGYRLRRVN